MKSYCWDNKGKEETEKYEFVKKYAEWIENPRQGECPYSDPDEVSILNYEFYGEITKFLKKQQERYSICFDYEWKFEKPESEKKYPEDRTIALKKSEDDDEAYLYLTSDQFGFSAITKEDRTWSPLKYPYAIYERCYKGDKSLIGDTIWYTRTIGGSFLWPKVKCRRNWQSSYNLYRGVSSYIEYRVDLTLYEIKEFYDEYVYKKEASDLKDKLKNKGSILLRDSDAEAIYNWLSIFKDFKTYVDFFCFNDFVNEEYYPKDIFTGKSITKDNISEYREKGKSKYKFIQNKATKNDLEKAFINLIIWTKDRSKNME